MTYHNTISNSDDVIDSRDVMERIDELEAMDGERDDDEHDELAALKALAEEGSCSPDWSYGETLIRDSYWVDYVRELCEDIGDVPKNIPDYIAIDWDKTADNIKADYTSVDFDGVDYWIRSC